MAPSKLETCNSNFRQLFLKIVRTYSKFNTYWHTILCLKPILKIWSTFFWSQVFELEDLICHTILWSRQDHVSSSEIKITGFHCNISGMSQTWATHSKVSSSSLSSYASAASSPCSFSKSTRSVAGNMSCSTVGTHRREERHLATQRAVWPVCNWRWLRLLRWISRAIYNAAQGSSVNIRQQTCISDNELKLPNRTSLV